MAAVKETPNAQRSYWSKEINAAKKRFDTFWTNGDSIVDEYRLQKGDNADRNKDKYNILYSSTETIRPNLYAQQPSVRVKLRHRDRASQAARDSVLLLNNNLQYVVEENDFDNLMEQCVEDLLLPGMGTAWVRYEPTFGPMTGEDGTPLVDEEGAPVEGLLEEQVIFDYVYWKDVLVGRSRGWATVPWIAKRVYPTKAEAKKRWGTAKANKLTYAAKENDSSDEADADGTAEVWEIWDKRTRRVYWFSEAYSGADLLDEKEDPLRLRKFFPCPRPMRAISNTRTFAPRALYTQYKPQAEQLHALTRRIRLLTEALRVVGVYDASQTELQRLLDPQAGNKMIPVESWVQLANQGGLKGSIEWLPIDAIIQTLLQLLQAREVCKNEIYEITGFSDIIRGVSKASETLGAQNIKANWAGARVKRMQKEVQRFARDLIAIAGEVISEHCSDTTIALFGGVEIPEPTDPNIMEIMQRFKAAVAVLRTEGRRAATVDIETDSTILADEEAERADRTAFLGAAGAFLQQAVPAMQATPEMGPLLGAMLMFVVRTFPSSRPIEEEFEKLQKAMNDPAAQQKKPEDNGAAVQAQARAQSAQAVAQIRAQSETERTTAQTQMAAEDRASKERIEAERLAVEREKEANRHAERMRELDVRMAELKLQEQQLELSEFERVLDTDEKLHGRRERAEERAAANEAVDSDKD